MPGPARVALDATLLDYSGGYRSAGIHRYLAGLAGALPALGVPVTLFTADPAARAHLPQVDVRLAPRWIRRRALRVLWAQSAFPLRARGAGCALVHGGAYAVPSWPGLVRVVTVHDLSFFRMPETLPRLQAAYLRLVTRHAVSACDAIIAVSEFTARELRDLLGAPEERTHVVPNGLDAGFSPPLPDQAASTRARLGVPGNYILTVGTLQPRKNLATLLDAYSRLVARHPEAPPLVVAGAAGWGDVRLDDMVKGLALADRVHQCGFVATGDLAALYAGAATFAYPSVYEGFGLPVLEAMACGVPVAFADGSAMTEVAGPAGVGVPARDPQAWADALERLLSDDGLAARLGQMGRARASAYTWERSARETSAVYDAVLSARSQMSVGVRRDPA
jgi:glycosyltransferase involved in cell wall biosynthesis